MKDWFFRPVDRIFVNLADDDINVGEVCRKAADKLFNATDGPKAPQT